MFERGKMAAIDEAALNGAGGKGASKDTVESTAAAGALV